MTNPDLVNPLVLAYLGDSIYEVYVRHFLLEQGICKVNELQKSSVKYVSARGQYSYLKRLIDACILSDKELSDRNTGEKVLCNSEEDIFKALELKYQKPEERDI